MCVYIRDHQPFLALGPKIPIRYLCLGKMLEIYSLILDSAVQFGGCFGKSNLAAYKTANVENSTLPKQHITIKIYERFQQTLS